jgi:hypothetical protein
MFHASIFEISPKVHHICINDSHPCDIQNIFKKETLPLASFESFELIAF